MGSQGLLQMVLTPGPDGHRPSRMTRPPGKGLEGRKTKLVVPFTDGLTEAKRRQDWGFPFIHSANTPECPAVNSNKQDIEALAPTGSTGPSLEDILLFR